MTKQFVPDPTLTGIAAQDDFIYWAYLYFYQTDSIPYSHYSPYHHQNQAAQLNSSQKEKIQDLYFQGFFIFKVLQCSFQDFYTSLTTQKSLYPSYRKSKESYVPGNWYYSHGVEFREPLKYSKKKHHQKKSLSEQCIAKKDWRDKKGFTKDYRKHSCPYGSRKKIAKISANRGFRHYVKQSIQKEQYDQFCKTKDRHFFDPWDWD